MERNIGRMLVAAKLAAWWLSKLLATMLLERYWSEPGRSSWGSFPGAWTPCGRSKWAPSWARFLGRSWPSVPGPPGGSEGENRKRWHLRTERAKRTLLANAPSER
jgi:hypothetical protein